MKKPPPLKIYTCSLCHTRTSQVYHYQDEKKKWRQLCVGCYFKEGG